MLLILLSLLQAYEFVDIDDANNVKYNVTTKLMYVYSRPTLRALPVARLTKGQSIDGDKVEVHENLTWVSYLEKNKTRRYVIAKDQRGQCFLEPCPEVPKPELYEEYFEEEYYEDEEEELEEEYIDEFSDAWYEDAVPDLTYNVTQRVLNVYSKPTLRSTLVGRFVKGQVIEGDKVEVAENLTWVSYVDKNNTRRYVIGKDYRGQCYVSPCPEVPKPELFEEYFDDEEFDMLDTARCGNSVSFLQKDFASSCPAIKKSGCLFLAICYMGGLCTQGEVLNFWAWSVRNGKVRSSDAYIQVGTDSLVNNCVKLYKFSRRAGSATTNSKRSHWWVVSGGKVVYNSVPGWF